VEQHLEWAHAIAAAVARRLPTWFTLEDLMGPAEIGLIQAASRYDAAKNDSFRGYAQRRVYGACIASIRRREYKERGHLSLEDVTDFRYTGARENSDRSGDNFELQIPAGGPGTDERAQVAITRRVVVERVRELPPAHARVMRAHYFRNMTLIQIAKEMDVTEAWVCRLHREAIEMLRLRCRDLKEAA
jgi:RNA polymerase sigma factor for flagellar operon FliA